MFFDSCVYQFFKKLCNSRNSRMPDNLRKLISKNVKVNSSNKVQNDESLQHQFHTLRKKSESLEHESNKSPKLLDSNVSMIPTNSPKNMMPNRPQGNNLILQSHGRKSSFYCKRRAFNGQINFNLATIQAASMKSSFLSSTPISTTATNNFTFLDNLHGKNTNHNGNHKNSFLKHQIRPQNSSPTTSLSTSTTNTSQQEIIPPPFSYFNDTYLPITPILEDKEKKLRDQTFIDENLSPSVANISLLNNSDPKHSTNSSKKPKFYEILSEASQRSSFLEDSLGLSTSRHIDMSTPNPPTRKKSKNYQPKFNSNLLNSSTAHLPPAHNTPAAYDDKNFKLTQNCSFVEKTTKQQLTEKLNQLIENEPEKSLQRENSSLSTSEMSKNAQEIQKYLKNHEKLKSQQNSGKNLNFNDDSSDDEIIRSQHEIDQELEADRYAKLVSKTRPIASSVPLQKMINLPEFARDNNSINVMMLTPISDLTKVSDLSDGVFESEPRKQNEKNKVEVKEKIKDFRRCQSAIEMPNFTPLHDFSVRKE